LTSQANRRMWTAAAQITHDDAGNLVQDRQGYRYQYDYENRFVRMLLLLRAENSEHFRACNKT